MPGHSTKPSYLSRFASLFSNLFRSPTPTQDEESQAFLSERHSIATTPRPTRKPKVKRADSDPALEFIPEYTQVKKAKFGLVGGMGWHATVAAEKKILKAAKVLGYRTEAEFPILKSMHETRPDRSKALENNGINDAESPVDSLVSGFKECEAAGAHIAFMPCNTAHAFLEYGKTKEDPGILQQINIPLLSLIDITLAFIKHNFPDIVEVGILATNGTVYSERVYHPRFRSEGINIITPDSSFQQQVMDAIYNESRGVKHGYTKYKPFPADIDPDLHPTNQFYKAALNLLTKMNPLGKKIIIAGCTEVPLALDQSDMPEDVILIDPMDLIGLANNILNHDKKFLKQISRVERYQLLKDTQIRLKSLSQKLNEDDELTHYQQLTKITKELRNFEYQYGNTLTKEHTLKVAFEAFTTRKPMTLDMLQTLQQDSKKRSVSPLPSPSSSPLKNLDYLSALETNRVRKESLSIDYKQLLGNCTIRREEKVCYLEEQNPAIEERLIFKPTDRNNFIPLLRNLPGLVKDFNLEQHGSKLASSANSKVILIEGTKPLISGFVEYVQQRSNTSITIMVK